MKQKLNGFQKKYKSLKSDLAPVITVLIQNPFQGTPLGKDCYKIRVAIAFKGKGKSGGARLITYIRITEKTVYLIDIYDKSEKDIISNKELQLLIDLLAP